MKKMMKIAAVAMMMVLMGIQMEVLACDSTCRVCKDGTENVSLPAAYRNDVDKNSAHKDLTAKDLAHKDPGQDDEQDEPIAVSSAKPSRVLSKDEIKAFVPEDTYLLNLDTGEVFYEKDLGERSKNEVTAVKIVAGQRYETGFVLRNDSGESLHDVHLRGHGLWFLEETIDKTTYWLYDWNRGNDDQIAVTFSSKELGTDPGYKTGIRVYAEKPMVLWSEGAGTYVVHNAGLADGKTLAPGVVGGLKGAEIGLIEKDQLTWVTARWEAKPSKK